VESIKSRRFKEGETFSRDEIGQIAGEFHSLYSELSRSREDLREHRDHLEELVAERTDRLSRINEKLEREITVRQKADEKLRAALVEKDLLIREVHHRVKNNMQMISSLLNLQAGYVRDSKYVEMFRESQNRIRSMSIVQEKVFESNDLSNIDFEDSIMALAKGLYRSYSTDTNRVSLKTYIRDVSMSIDTAIPCALIINELMSNCLRHAFPGGGKGEITVSLVRAQKGEFELTVADDGVGVPEGLNLYNASSLGFQIVTTIATEQLHGKVDYTSDGGLRVMVGFKEIEYRART
jgi:two-component sensor histidine kinase